MQGACQTKPVQKNADKSADELPEKWQGFDRINGIFLNFRVLKKVSDNCDNNELSKP